MGYTEEGIGYQSRETSFAAAVSDKDKKLSLREQTYRVLLLSKVAISADEIATKLNRSFISIRPRVTELANDKRIRDSGHRGKTNFGKTCILWEVNKENQIKNKFKLEQHIDWD
tara:strand:- start:216 stop:557 length:342 start_codon:yes stop_codon:yes gene_type:complete